MSTSGRGVVSGFDNEGMVPHQFQGGWTYASVINIHDDRAFWRLFATKIRDLTAI